MAESNDRTTAGNEWNDPLRWAAVVAHQLKSPIGAAETALRTVVEGLVGPLTPQQRDLLSRADVRLQEALETARRLLRLAHPGAEAPASCDVAALAHVVAQSATEEAQRRTIALSVDVRVQPARASIGEEALREVLRALLENALKYTPSHGQVRILVDTTDGGERVLLAVGDSGPGVPPEDRDRIFEPFFRGRLSALSSTPGLGLGLALVRVLVTACGGAVTVTNSDLGGAEFIVMLPRAAGGASETATAERLRVVIVGGVAAGPKVASKVMRLRPDAEVTIIERGEILSYAGCGLPYYISGVVRDRRALLSTPLGAVRDPIFFQNVRNVTVLRRTEAEEIDRSSRRVRVRNLETGEVRWIAYDKLVLATGARPVVPDLPGRTLRNIHTLHGVHEAESIRHAVLGGRALDVVLVGGGLIAMEMTKALARRGCRITVVERLPQILSILDEDMARLLEHHVESHGVRILTDTEVTGFRGDGVVRAVLTTRGELPADLVIIAAGVRPETALARAAGLELGTTGAIRVNAHMQTSDPDIYAVGDCAETTDILTGSPTYVPLGSTANKQGRVAAVHICGGEDSFPGVLGTVVCEVFDYCVGRTGLTEREARERGMDVVAALCAAPDREHFLPEANSLMLKLLVDRASRRVVGLQTLGPGAGDKRLDVAATAIFAGLTVDQLANLDLGYAPPYSSALDNLITACNIARNKLAGHMPGVSAFVVREWLERQDAILVDVSTPGEFAEMRIPGARLMPLGSLRGRLHELPRDQRIVLYCRSSLRAYEASIILRHAGYSQVYVLDGGVLMWPFDRVYGS